MKWLQFLLKLSVTATLVTITSVETNNSLASVLVKEQNSSLIRLDNNSQNHILTQTLTSDLNVTKPEATNKSTNSFVGKTEISTPTGISPKFWLALMGLGATASIFYPRIVLIKSDKVGIVDKKFGRSLPSNNQIALNGEMGVQIATLDPGRHFLFPSWMYKVSKEKAIEIDTDEIGIVKAKDGKSLPPGRMFGKVIECDNFQNGREFIKNGGQRGKQLAILRNGIYRINTRLFEVEKSMITHIYDGEIGVVEAKEGKTLPAGMNFGRVVDCNNFEDAQAFINNGGQRGKQLAILSAGIYEINTELFNVLHIPVVNIPLGEIGLIVAQDGASKPPGQILGDEVDCNNFQDAEAFIKNGGHKGKQRGILSAGTYRINTELFTVITSKNATEHDMKPEDFKTYKVESDKIGIVTTFDGNPLTSGNIAAPVINGQNRFQNVQQFINAGGYRGLQEEILEEGSWKLNPWFAKVKQIPLTKIQAGTVGVVISNIGKNIEKFQDENTDQSGLNIVPRGYKGIEETPLAAGKYPINTRVKSIEIVPTHDITLDWTNKDKKLTDYDSSLKTLELHSQDGFSFELEVTQVINIASKNAPKLISRVGSPATSTIDKLVDHIVASDDAVKYSSIQNLVVRVLEPMVGSYFRDAAQKFNALDFLKNRDEIQAEATQHIKMALNAYGVQAVSTLINEINLPEELEEPIKNITIAQVTKEQLIAEQVTEEENRKLEEKRRLTDFQAKLVEAENNTKLAKQEAERIKIIAEAKADAQQLKNNTDLLMMQAKEAIETARIELEEQLKLSCFKETINTLSPELYVKMKTDKMWAKAFAQFDFKAPTTLINGSNGNNSSDGLNDLLAGGLQMQIIEMMTERLSNRKPNNSQPDMLASGDSQPELLPPESSNPAKLINASSDDNKQDDIKKDEITDDDTDEYLNEEHW